MSKYSTLYCIFFFPFLFTVILKIKNVSSVQVWNFFHDIPHMQYYHTLFNYNNYKFFFQLLYQILTNKSNLLSCWSVN